MKIKILMTISIFLLLISGCGTIDYAATSDQMTLSPTSDPTATPTPIPTLTPTPSPIPSPSPTPEPTPTPTPEFNEAYKAIRDTAGTSIPLNNGKEGYIEVTDGVTVYPKYTVALFDDSELACTLEGVRTVDPLSNKRYILIDFSIWNLSDDEFTSSESYLSLADKISGYTYNTTYYFLDDISAPVGDLDMSLKSGDMTWGEVVFEVPYRASSILQLRCDIPDDEIGRAIFTIDLSDAVNQNGIQSSSIR